MLPRRAVRSFGWCVSDEPTAGLETWFFAADDELCEEVEEEEDGNGNIIGGAGGMFTIWLIFAAVEWPDSSVEPLKIYASRSFAWN